MKTLLKILEAFGSILRKEAISVGFTIMNYRLTGFSKYRAARLFYLWYLQV